MWYSRIVAAALALAVAPTVSQAQKDRFALVIGIAGYPRFAPAKRLKFADQDANDFARFLKSPEGGAFPSDHVKLLTNVGATREAITDSIASLRRTITPGSLLYVFFSGHTAIDANGFAHLMPYDADPGRPQDKGWRISTFQQQLSGIGAQFFILFLDACHAGAGTVGDQTIPDDDDGSKSNDELSVKLHVEWNRAFERLRSQDGVIFSSSANQDSYEDDQYHHGIFSYFLLRGLHGAADSAGAGNRDGTVTVWELMRFLADSVPRRALQVRGKYQVPDMTQALSPLFPLAKYAVNTPPARSAVNTPLSALFATAATARSHFDAAYRFGNAGNDADAVVEYRAALAIDPNYSMARNNLAVALSNLGDSATAIAEYRETIRRDPGHTLARRNLALHVAGNGDTAQAISLLRESLRLNPGLADAHSDLGNLLRLRGQFDSALVHLSSAFHLDSLDVSAWARYGALQADMGYKDVGILFEAWSLTVAQRNPNVRRRPFVNWVAGQLATLYESAHDRESAIRVLHQAYRDDPNFTSEPAREAALAAALQKLRDSVATLRQALALNAKNETAFRALHNVLHEDLLNADDALKAMDGWLSTNAIASWSASDRAENYFTALRFVEAEQALRITLLRTDLAPSSRAALLAVSAANDYASGRAADAPTKLAALENLIAAQPDTFTVQWVFFGTRNTLRTLSTVTALQRSALLNLIAALGKPKKSEILAGVRSARVTLR